MIIYLKLCKFFCYDIKNTDANTYKSRKKKYLEIFCKYFITTI